MPWIKVVLGFILIFLVVGLLAFYWFNPLASNQFFSNSPVNSNFTLNSSQPSGMQFYPNLRYPTSNISYNIDSTLCNLQRQDDIKTAMNIIQNLTLLNFYPTDNNPEISITCDDKVIVNKSYFIAGEGGPVNITEAGNYNVITQGKVLLLRDSNCQTPNIAIHELLHALGFAHSQNPNNIMYPVTNCQETIGQDIPNLINSIYSVPSYPDLLFTNASAFMHGRYLDANITIVNYGLQDSPDANLVISADGNKIDNSTIDSVDIGSGITFQFKNIFVSNVNVNEIEYTIQSNFSELSKDNNQIKIKI